MRYVCAVSLLFLAASAAHAQSYLGFGELVAERQFQAVDDRAFGFGRAVVAFDDSLVVGAAGGMDMGSIFVYGREAGIWVERQRIEHPHDPDLGWFGDQSGFGFSVVRAGDRLLVGAPFTVADGERNAGAVFVLERDAETGLWAIERRFTAPAPAASGQFGFALAYADGTLFVGQPSGQPPLPDFAEPDVGYIRPGRVFAFERDAGTGDWVLTATLEDGVDDDRFGAALAAAGDDLIVGGPGGDGAVHWYRLGGGVLALVDSFADPDGGRAFGRALSLHGGRLLAGGASGTVSASIDPPSSGIAHLLALDGVELTMLATFESDENDDRFGVSVLLLDGGHALVAAPVSGVLHLYAEHEDWSLVQRVTEPVQSIFSGGFGEVLVRIGDRVYAGAPTSLHHMGFLPSFLRGGHMYEFPVIGPPLVDLELELQYPASVSLDDHFEVRYEVANHSDSAALAAFVTIFRNRADYVISDPVDTVVPEGCFELRAAVFRCELGAIDPGAIASVTIEYHYARARVPATHPGIRTDAYAGSERADPDTTDNESMVSITLLVPQPPAEPPPEEPRRGGGGTDLVFMAVLALLLTASLRIRNRPGRRIRA